MWDLLIGYRFGAVLEEFEVRDALMGAFTKKGNGAAPVPITYDAGAGP